MAWCLLMLCLALCVTLGGSFPYGCRSLAVRPARQEIYVAQHRARSSRTPVVSGSRMYFFGNFFRVIASNFNSLVKRWEDPEKMLDQTLVEMQRDLTRVRQAYAEVTVTLKRGQQQVTNGEEVMTQWYKRAQIAINEGDDELAKEALRERELQRKVNSNLAEQIRIQTSAHNKLQDSIKLLENKISEAQKERNSFVARAKAAKATLHVNQMLDSLTSSSTTSALDAFNRMKEKVESMELQADITNEKTVLSQESNLGTRYDSWETNAKIENEFESLKKQKTESIITYEDIGGNLFVETNRHKNKISQL